MQILRKFLVWLAALVLPTALFSFGLLLSLYVVVGRSGPVKSAADNSGIYSVIVDSLLAQNKDTISGIPLNDPAIKKIFETNFTPTLMQQTGDHVIDGTYAWLQGKTTTPQFNVYLTGARNKTTQDIAAYVATKINSLPACSASQSYSILQRWSSVNLYELSCRPGTIDLKTLQDQVRDMLVNSDSFEHSVEVIALSTKDSNGQTLQQQSKDLPIAYQWMVKGIYIVGALSVLAAAAIIFLSLARRSGLRHVSVTFLSVGAIGTVLAISSTYVTGKVEDFVAKSWGTDQALQIQVKVTSIIHTLMLDVRHWWLSISIVELILGLAGLIILFITRPKRLAMVASTQNAPAVGTEQNIEAAKNLTNNNFPNSNTKQKPGA